jgi:tellurite methyltransferase
LKAASGPAPATGPIEFFDRQFRQQAGRGESALNPFEQLALEHVRGRVLDLGCGLGNLALAAARRGCEVTAVDGSDAAIGRIRSAAAAERLALNAVQADLNGWPIEGQYDTVLAIGLLMFFARPRALELLGDIQAHVAPGGRAVVNTFVEGTTWLEPFAGQPYCLLGRDELAERFAGWRILECRFDRYAAPGGTLKEFVTLAAERP